MRKSFWQLINEKQIQIPNYQREYAQGRDNNRAELIRKGFIRSLYDAIINKNSLELDFIFGGKEEWQGVNNDSFEPVDGQQRLTMLFLLHWYIFMKSGECDKQIELLGKHFKYMTRTTSEYFCYHICSIESVQMIRDCSGTVSDGIKNMPWFTGAMESDPTVKSMLVVLDCIHGQIPCDFNYKEAATLLQQDIQDPLNGCPITFNCLDLNNELDGNSGVRDLYIKMNTRGLLLTDFEVFKADLQKKDEDNGSFDLLGSYLKEEDSELRRAEIIGEFNNAFTNFFFRLIDNGEIKEKGNFFDISMMNFINEVFRMNYFLTVSELGVVAKKYRYDNDDVRKMSGKEFSNFIRKRGDSYTQSYWNNNEEIPVEEIEKALTSSLDECIELLRLFSEYYENNGNLGFDNDGENRCRILLSDMMKQYKDPKELSNRGSLLHMAIYEFIRILGKPDSDDKKAAFITWSRFVWKIDRNLDFKSFDEVIETLKGYKKILESCNEYNEAGVIRAIAESISSGGIGGPAKIQYEEEVRKARLICEDKNWKDIIIEAEDYYSNDKDGVDGSNAEKGDGQIWFLLEMANVEGKDNLDYFKKAFELSKKIFNGSRKLTIDSGVFEKALLAISVRDEILDHLLPMAKGTIGTKKFVGDNFFDHISHEYCAKGDDAEKARYDITALLLKEILKAGMEIADLNEWNIENWLKAEYIDKTIEDDNDWKNIFIKNDLLNKTVGDLTFKNGFEPGAWKDDNNFGYTAVYTTVSRRGNSGELYSFLLGVRLQERSINCSYKIEDFRVNYINEAENFPTRYLIVNGYDIGYIKGEYWRRKHDTDEVPTKIGDLNEALNWFSNPSD